MSHTGAPSFFSLHLVSCSPPLLCRKSSSPYPADAAARHKGTTSWSRTRSNHRSVRIRNSAHYSFMATALTHPGQLSTSDTRHLFCLNAIYRYLLSLFFSIGRGRTAQHKLTDADGIAGSLQRVSYSEWCTCSYIKSGAYYNIYWSQKPISCTSIYNIGSLCACECLLHIIMIQHYWRALLTSYNHYAGS